MLCGTPIELIELFIKRSSKIQKGTLIIDVSCDPNLEIETSHATTIDNPVYEVDG